MGEPAQVEGERLAGAGRGGGGQRENVEVGTRAGTRSRAMGREVEAPERFVPRLGL